MQFRVFITSATEKWEVPFRDFSFTEELNNDKNATFSFEVTALEKVALKYAITAEYIISAAYREVQVVDENDEVIYYGVLDEPTVSGGMSEGSVLTVTSRGFLSLFSKRVVTSAEYNAQDMSDIAWDLINDSQSLTEGDFGINRGADPSTVSRDRTFRNRYILDALFTLSNSNIKNGIDFDVDNAKDFNVYYPAKGSQRDNIRLELGFNIKTWTVRKTGIWAMANQVIVLGDGFGDDTLSVTRDSDLSYKEAYFLLQDIVSEKDVIETDTLEDKGDREIDLRQAPVKAIDLSTEYELPLFTDYEVGDSLKVVIDDSMANIDGFYRVIKRTLRSDGTVYLSFFPA